MTHAWVPSTLQIRVVCLLLFVLLNPRLTSQASGTIWWEAEHPVRHTFPPSNSFSPNTREERDALSAGDWLQTDRAAGARISYRIEINQPGTYQFWSRKFWKHGPFRWRFDDQPWQTCSRDITLADRTVLRTHLEANWVHLGEVTLDQGHTVLWIEMLPDAGPAAFDCFLLTDQPFIPNGKLKPGQALGRSDPGYLPFEPPPDPFDPSPIDLRSLNHPRAGDHGFVIPQGTDFIYQHTGDPARFWGVNLGILPTDDASRAYLARKLAKLGVNLARFHHRVSTDRPDQIDTQRIDNTILMIEALADEGIYSTLSFYFPLWIRLNNDPRFPGYTDQQPPFALLFFDRTFQAQHRAWMKALLHTPSPRTGVTLADNTAVAWIEIQNEDSLLFWTFSPYETISQQATQTLERVFANWLRRRHNDLASAFTSWGVRPGSVKGDDLDQGRVGLYPAGFLTNQDWAKNARNPRRASDQLAFFTDLQTAFYAATTRYLREDLNVRCAIVASNWITADDPTLLPLEKLSNTVTGSLDRHAYIGGRHEGDAASYDLRPGQTYQSRSTIAREIPATSRPEYADTPHVISEYGYPMPNAHRAEATFLAATTGRASGLDAIIFFSVGTLDWERQLTKFSTLSPAVAGQFPAAARIFRQGLVSEAPIVIREQLTRTDLLAFKGSQLARPADLDDLRAVGPQAVNELSRNTLTSIAPLLGRTRIEPDANESRLIVADDLKAHRSPDGTITSVNGELTTDLNRRLLILNTPAAQGVIGELANAGEVITRDTIILATNDHASILIVALDDRPLVVSERILIQAVTEETNYGWKTTPTDNNLLRIDSIGSAPIQTRPIRATIDLKVGTNTLRITTLDHNGYPTTTQTLNTPRITLNPNTFYTLVEPLR